MWRKCSFSIYWQEKYTPKTALNLQLTKGIERRARTRSGSTTEITDLPSVHTSAYEREKGAPKHQRSARRSELHAGAKDRPLTSVEGRLKRNRGTADKFRQRLGVVVQNVVFCRTRSLARLARVPKRKTKRKPFVANPHTVLSKITFSRTPLNP